MAKVSSRGGGGGGGRYVGDRQGEEILQSAIIVELVAVYTPGFAGFESGGCVGEEVGSD